MRSHPIGTGPYRFVRYLVDDRLELAAFDDYFGGRPKNDGLVLRVVPDDIMRGLDLGLDRFKFFPAEAAGADAMGSHQARAMSIVTGTGLLTMSRTGE